MPKSVQVALRERVLAVAHEMTRLPLLPEFAHRVLEISRLPPDDVDISYLAQLVSRDSAMVARIFRVANSPHYGLKTRVTTVRQAIVTIGLNDFLGLLLATSICNTFKSDTRLENLDLAQLWVHSLAVGAAAQAISSSGSIPMLSLPEINLVGLLHDIGKSIFCASFPEQYDQCLQRVKTSSCLLEEVEVEEMGISHAALGGIMAEEWQLPDQFTQTVRYHHSPNDAPDIWRNCAWLVARADSFVLSEGIGQSGNRPRNPAQMEEIAPDPNGEAPRATSLFEKDRTLVLDQVLWALKGAMIQWETKPNPDGNNPMPDVDPSPKSITPGPEPHSLKAPAGTERQPTWVCWMRQILQYFHIRT